MNNLVKESREAIRAFIENPTRQRLIAIKKLTDEDNRAAGPCLVSKHCVLKTTNISECAKCPLGTVNEVGDTMCWFVRLDNPITWKKHKATILKALIEFQAGL
jgi:hypothetical protein